MGVYLNKGNDKYGTHLALNMFIIQNLLCRQSCQVYVIYLLEPDRNF